MIELSAKSVACAAGLAGRSGEIIVVDPAVDGARVLLDGRRADAEMLHLTAGTCGLQQIARHLAGSRNVRAIHILSHGEPGALMLAGERIGLPGLVVRSGVLAEIARSLAADARIVLYGCAIAAESPGRRFIDYLEASLGVAVAASAAPVGSAALGGGWTLRDGKGAAVEPIFAAAARAGFTGLLASVTGTAGNDLLDGVDGLTTGNDDASGLDGNDTISALDGNDSLFGGAGSDTLYGGGDQDTLYGGAGNDFLYGQTGNDIVYGEDGNDGMSGGDGNDTLYGGGGNDTAIGGSGADLLSGGIGNDWIWGGAGNDLEYGGAGTDTLSGGDGEDTLYGEADNDTLSGRAGNDVLYGGAGNDSLHGGANDDTLSGGAGTDLLTGGAGIDLLVGGDGNDTFGGSAADFNGDTISDFAIGETIVVTGTDLTALNGTTASSSLALGSGTLTLTGISSASGTFSAVLNGANTEISLVARSGGGGGGESSNSGSVVVRDSSGDSTGGSRTITNNSGSTGSAAIVQNTGNNGNVVTATLPGSVSISSEGPSTAQTATEAVNTLVGAIQSRGSTGESGLVGNAQTFLTRLATDTMLDIRTIVPTQGSGVTTDDPIVITGTASGSQSEAFVVDMRSITGKELQVNNIEFVSIVGSARVTGGSGNNYATGDDGNQFISLGEGDDTLYGGDGNDTIGSAAGNDSLFGDGGSDTVIGGTGNDSLWGGTGTDVLYGNVEADMLYGNQQADTLYGGQDTDSVFGGQDADLLYGNLADDVLYGNMGADTLFGGQGNDALFGGQDADLLIGNVGNDTLNGNLGNDTISTGEGADLVVVESNGGIDVVADFEGAAGDQVQIAGNLNGTSINTFTEVVASASNNGDGSVTIALGAGNTLTLNGVTASELQSGWFTFS